MLLGLLAATAIVLFTGAAIICIAQIVGGSLVSGARGRRQRAAALATARRYQKTQRHAAPPSA